MRHDSQPRGQTLLLLVLSLFLLTLMVTMTLSFGIKAKEKMETQTLADAAAYSNAVATARAFNYISLINRTSVSHMVSMAATQAAISWSGAYRGYIGAINTRYRDWKGDYDRQLRILCSACPACPANTCACLAASSAWAAGQIAKSAAADAILQARWQGLDRAAGIQARSFQNSVNLLQIEQMAFAGELLYSKLLSNKLTEDVFKDAKNNSGFNGGSEWMSPGAGWVNMREVGVIDIALDVEHVPLPYLAFGGAANSKRPASVKQHHVSAAMGSRGNLFVTARSGSNAIIQAALNNPATGAINVPDNTLVVRHSGSTNYAAAPAVHGFAPATSQFALAEDHGALRINWFFVPPVVACEVPPAGILIRPRTGQLGGPPANVDAFVLSSQLGMVDLHLWSPAVGFCPANVNPNGFHTMGRCSGNCPGFWPMFMDYNFVNMVLGPLDNYAQPKQLGVVIRDYGNRAPKLNYTRNGQADPWNLLFNFRFTPPGNPGQTFDGRGIQMADGTDISRQMSVSTAVAYYHRRGAIQGGWGEPPNFMNPWWRATLVGPANPRGNPLSRRNPRMPDMQWDGDIDGELGRAPFARDAYNQLKNAGFEGWL